LFEITRVCVAGTCGVVLKGIVAKATGFDANNGAAVQLNEKLTLD